MVRYEKPQHTKKSEQPALHGSGWHGDARLNARPLISFPDLPPLPHTAHTAATMGRTKRKDHAKKVTATKEPQHPLPAKSSTAQPTIPDTTLRSAARSNWSSYQNSETWPPYQHDGDEGVRAAA